VKTCNIGGCNGEIKAKGFCNRHYKQMRRCGKTLERTQRDPNEIIIRGDIAEIVLYDKNCNEKARTIIDAEDVEKVKKYKWRLACGYVRTILDRKSIGIQHLIMGAKPDKKKIIDHKDRNPLNNQKANLRFCTHADNRRNGARKSDNTSGFKGVYLSKATRMWIAQIAINRKCYHLGTFKNKIKAAIAYNEAAIKHYGEFANVNKIGAT